MAAAAGVITGGFVRLGHRMRDMVEALLREREFERLADLCLAERRVWKRLRAILFATDEALSWPAVEAVARVMKRQWSAGRRERVRNYVRSLLWLINDESGGIGWNAPQTIAAIIREIPELADPYAGMMIDRALGEPPLVRSGLWGIGRLGEGIRETVEFLAGPVLACFTSDDPEILGHAAWAVGEVGLPPAGPFLEKLRERREAVRIYIDGSMREKTLGEWAEEALERLRPDGASF